MKDIRVASVQMNHAPGDLAANMAKVESFVQAAADQNVQLIVFPEMCLTGYWHVRNLDRGAVEELAEPVPTGPQCQQIAELSRRHNMTIGVGLIEQDGDGTLFNSYFVAMPDGAFACHRKLHTFISSHMESGDRFTVFDTPHGCRVGVLICYDNNLVENARINALLGAEVLLSPHQTGGCRSRSPHAMGSIDPQLWANRQHNPTAVQAEFQGDKGRGWLMRWLPARAHDNGLFLLFSNGVGTDDDEVRTGNAMVLDPYGQVISESRSIEDDMVIADLKAELQPTSSGRRWLEARRPELYGPICQPSASRSDMRDIRLGPSAE